MPAATKDSWNTLPAPERREPLGYDAVFTDAEFDVIRRGLEPQAMEDRWFVYFADGWLHLYRSWSGFLIYWLRLEECPAGVRVTEAWVNRDPEQYEGESLEHERATLDWIIRHLLLGHDNEFPTHQAKPDGQSVTVEQSRGKPFAPTDVRYIKLGRGGEWEERCLHHDQTIMLGYRNPHHADACNGDWDAVYNFWLEERDGKAGVAKSDLNQIRDFYTLPETALWVTFHARYLYWCFADSHVEELPGGERVRKAIGGWKRESLTGVPLRIENLDGRLTKVQGFRGTICSVASNDYLVRKIRGDVQPDVQAAQEARQLLLDRLGVLIEGLWWKDFELLVDLVFAETGWQRVSVLGGAEKDLDLDLLAPVTRRRAFVQVKSSATLATLHESIASFRSMPDFDEMYFVVHSADSALRNLEVDGVMVVDLPKLAEWVVSAGLVDWLITKRS